MSKKTVVATEGRPTRNDVALKAKVSGTTVSRVFGGNSDRTVSPDRRDRVLAAAKELGYAPNSAAQALRSGRSGLIGFWMCLAYSRYRSMVLDQMRLVLASTELALAVTDVDTDYRLRHTFDRALRLPVEGIISFDMSTAGDVFARESAWLAPNVPYVSMGAYWSEAKSHVGIDLRAGAEEAMEHLLSTGRRDIAYITTDDSDDIVEAGRFEGYEFKMKQAGLTPRKIVIEADPSHRITRLSELLRRFELEGNLPDGLLCMFDEIAVDAVEAMMSLGLKPGADIAVVGINGTEGLERGPYPISTVRQPIEEMCGLAFEFLQAQMEDPSAPLLKRVLKPSLVIRQSSMPS